MAYLVRNFDAIEIDTSYRNYFLNRPRLQTAIAIISLVGFNHQAVGWMRDEYPALNTMMAENYVEAAQVCIVHKLKV